MTNPKNNTPVQIFCLLVAGLTMGCPSVEEQAAAQRKEAQTETTKAARDARDDAFEKRAEFIVQMQEELGKVETELDALAAELEAKTEAKAEAKAAATAELKAARDKHAKTMKELALTESATESTWKDVRSSFQTSYDDLKDSIDKARQTASDAIEPS